MARLLAGAAPTEPPHDLVVADVDQHHRGDAPVELGELGVERLRLRCRPREAVEDEAVAGLLGVDPLGDHADDDLVGNQVAAVHVGLRVQADLGLVLDRGAEDVPGRVVGQAQVFVQKLALRALAGTGRTKEDEVELRWHWF